MDFALQPPPVPAVAVSAGGSFPVRRIFCVARNYAEHAREMGSDPVREPPFFFTKPADAVVASGAQLTPAAIDPALVKLNAMLLNKEAEGSSA